jgi:dTDP-4-dehydrorhamnose 3,5-epimerase
MSAEFSSPRGLVSTATSPILFLMTLQETSLRDVKLIRPKRFGDARGWFAEVFNTGTFSSLGLPASFAQDNQSFSAQGVLRGLHYQLGSPQGKLVRVLSGHIWDVAVDLRRDSPDFGRWAGFDLRPRTAEGELEMLWIPEGFAHGFLVLSETAEVLYKTTRGYFPSGERTILWDDPTLAISWPLDQLQGTEVSVSAKDARGSHFADAELP